MCKTLLDALRALEPVTDRGFVFLDDRLQETAYSFAEVVAHARQRGQRLQALGLKKGDRLALILPENEDFVLTFLGAVSVGVVPVPMYPPLALGKLDGYMQTAARILDAAGARMLVTSSKLAPLLWSVMGRARTLERIVQADALRRPETGVKPAAGQQAAAEVTEDDTCFLQFTSGSTAVPKGVMVTHRNLVANAHAIVRDGLGADQERDRAVTWLPLYHDMGLIGFVLAPLLYRLPVVFIPTMSFVKRPSLWMEMIHRHRATLTFGPNFAFAVAAKHAARQAPQSWDLTCLRVVGCGAEPIQAGTLRRFIEAHAPFGLDPRAVMPSYGMAEGTLALSFDSLDAPFRTVVIDREAYERDAQAVPVPGAEAGRERTELVACGRTFPGHRLAIMGENGTILPERAVGEIVFRGPSVTAGYFGDQQATRASFRDGWLHTGDLGFLLDGELYISGRQKDLIILHGRNYYPQAIEWEVERVAGIRKGNAVAFAVAGQDSERLVIAAETQRVDQADLALLLHEVKAQVAAELGLVVADVVLLSPGALPKTSSGKVQRRRTRADYEQGSLGRRGSRLLEQRVPWLGVARHLAAAALARLRHLGPARAVREG